MARDLVQVMTDCPVDEITVAVHLPADLAEVITAMRHARDKASAAENAACEAQQAAATALRNADALLRDIAVALGVSHQRVHQVLEEADATRIRHLEQFRQEVDVSLKDGAQASNCQSPVTTVVTQLLSPSPMSLSRH